MLNVSILADWTWRWKVVMCCYCDYTLRDTWYSIRYISVYLSVLLSTVSVWKTSRGANKASLWLRGRYSHHHHFNFKRLPYPHLIYKMSHYWTCLAVVDNQLSIDFLGYLLQPTNTLSWCSLALNRTNCSNKTKKDLHISLHCIVLRRMVTTGFIPLSLQRCSVWR